LGEALRTPPGQLGSLGGHPYHPASIAQARRLHSSSQQESAFRSSTAFTWCLPKQARLSTSNTYNLLIVTLGPTADDGTSVAASAEHVAAFLAAATEDLIVATDPAGVVTVFNRGAERMLGYAAQDVVGRQTPLLWHDPSEVNRRAAELGLAPGFDVFVHAAKHGNSETREWTVVRSDGTRRSAHLTVTPVIGVDGQIEGYLGIAHDVTIRHQAEEALRHAEARYRTLVEQLPSITYISALDETSTALYVSPQVERLVGFSPKEWLADPALWVKQIHPDDRDAVLDEFARCRSSGEPFVAEYRLVARDGRAVWFHDEAAVVRPDADQPAFLQGGMLDITERKRAEDAARAAEAKYRSIVENAVEGIYQSSPAGRVLTANRALAHMLRYASPEELVRDVSDAAIQIYVDPRDRAALVGQLLERGTVEAFECSVRRKDGSVIWILQNVRAVFDENGLPLYFEGTVEDITARKQVEADHARLERERDEFFSSISHDLRTPLAAITASIGVVLANEPSGMPPALHRLLVNIDQSADDMGRLVEDLLELNRLQAGRVKLSREHSDLRDVALRAVRQIETLAQGRGQHVELDLPPEPLEGWVDVQVLGRVLLNLLGNANKYGRDNGAIVLRLEEHPREAVFSVIDDGAGIPTREHEHIFERFYRADSLAHRDTKGSGLGLPIARSLVELHGGRIWVESVPGRGATFRIALPFEACGHDQESDER
jgi:PAS domain S-box-containing protein